MKKTQDRTRENSSGVFLGSQRLWAVLWDSAASQEEAESDVTGAPVLADGGARGKLMPGVHRRDLETEHLHHRQRWREGAWPRCVCLLAKGTKLNRTGWTVTSLLMPDL